MEPLGPKLRKQRRKLGLTLDELAGRTSISKPYLSLIETGRVNNPPSDEKLRRLEQTLGFSPGELVTQAHLQRTPGDVRAVLRSLMRERSQNAVGETAAQTATRIAGNVAANAARSNAPNASSDKISGKASTLAMKPPLAGGEAAAGIDDDQGTALGAAMSTALGIDLDAAYMSGVLQQLVDRTSGNVESIALNVVPVINRVSAGYPKDFTDLAYPRGVADDYLSCPDVHDKDAFGCRVHGDSMTPKYREGDIVIFSPAASCRDGDDCFVRFEDGQTTFKRVFFESDESQTPVLRLQPRNERYRPQVIPSERVTGLYKAVYRYQSVDD